MKNYLEKEKIFVSIIIHIEDKHKEYINEYFNQIDDYFHKKFETYEYIIVNNACSINIKKKLEEIYKNLMGNVTVINLSWKHNIEDAMNAGLDLSIGDFVFEFDQPRIDFNISFIYEIYRECLDGYDIVAAAPKNNINLLSRAFYSILNKVSYKNMDLKTETFRIVSRRALNRILATGEKFRYRKAVYHYSGFNTKVIEYHSKFNIKSVHTLKEKIGLAIDVFIYYSNLGTKVCALISFIFLLLSVSGGIYTIVIYIVMKTIQPGWTTTMLFLSGSFTGLFFILTIISKYLETIIKEIQNKPNYIYKSIDKISQK